MNKIEHQYTDTAIGTHINRYHFSIEGDDFGTRIIHFYVDKDLSFFKFDFEFVEVSHILNAGITIQNNIDYIKENTRF